MADLFILVENHPDKGILEVTLDEEKCKEYEEERWPGGHRKMTSRIMWLSDDEILAAAERIKAERAGTNE